MPLSAGIKSSPAEAARYAFCKALLESRIRGSPARSRRTPQKTKAYIPHYHDNPNVGRRTGIAIPRVQCDDDGFEPFEEVLKQADSDDYQGMRGSSAWAARLVGSRAMAHCEVECEEGPEGDDEEEEMLSMDPILAGMRTPTSPTPKSRSVATAPMLTEPRSRRLEFQHIGEVRTLEVPTAAVV